MYIHLSQAWANYSPGAGYGLFGFFNLTCPNYITDLYYYYTSGFSLHGPDVTNRWRKQDHCILEFMYDFYM